MLFQFLKYLQPTHYFSLIRKNGLGIYPIVNELPESIQNQLISDATFSSLQADNADLSWQAIHKGYIGKTQRIDDYKNQLPVIDEYRFIRKYFSPVWVFYVLIIRLCSFKNPIKEIHAYLKTHSTKRSSYIKTPITYDDWDNYNSELILSEPKISVIIPTLNRYNYLRDVLQDLEKQDYRNFDVIIVDQSEPFDAQFYHSFNLDLEVIPQKEKALWLARNTAVKRSNSNFFLFFDDDSRIEANWISSHLKCLDYFKADLSSGVSISKVGARVPEHYSFFKISDQLDTGNVLIKKDVFHKIGLFDRQFEKQRMGDGEFGLRCYLNGFLNISNPYAQRLHLKVKSGGLREMGSWDAFRTEKWFAPRPIPSVLYFFRMYFGNKRAKLALLRMMPLSVMPYRFKKNKFMQILGLLLSIIILPLIIAQVMRSWKLSSKKLNQGPLIDYLN